MADTIFKTGINGGMPLTQQDFGWIINSLKAGTANGLTISGNTNYVISGVRAITIAGNFIGNTEGFVLLAGQVCYVPADNVGIDIVANPFRYIELVTVNDGSIKTFYNSTAQNVRLITTAKINGYAAVQAGKEAWEMPYYEDILDDIIFNVGADVAISAGHGLTLPALSNVFKVDIAPVDTLALIIKLSPAMNVLWLNFVGVSATDTVTVVNSGDIVTPGGVNYVFTSGDWAMFIKDALGMYKLVTKGTPVAVTVASGDMLNGWASGTQPLTYRQNNEGMVYLDGIIGGNTPGAGSVQIYKLPIVYAPLADIYREQILIIAGTATTITITIDTAGYISVGTALALNFTLNLNGTTYYKF